MGSSASFIAIPASLIVIPAKAGIQPNWRLSWMPAYAGMTNLGNAAIISKYEPYTLEKYYRAERFLLKKWLGSSGGSRNDNNKSERSHS